MSERVYLPGENVLGLDMPDAQYNVARKGDGFIEVSDLHADVLKMYTGLQVGRRYMGASEAPGKVCSVCGFEAYAALAGPLCKRCGGNWE